MAHIGLHTNLDGWLKSTLPDAVFYRAHAYHRTHWRKFSYFFVAPEMAIRNDRR